ncbi:MAG: hypothetical protein IKN72_00745, partial [Clostridia bacterium]|nr:hypothetical protein [Clostridia bacterium]
HGCILFIAVVILLCSIGRLLSPDVLLCLGLPLRCPGPGSGPGGGSSAPAGRGTGSIVIKEDPA